MIDHLKLASFLLAWIIGMGLLSVACIWIYITAFQWILEVIGIKQEFVRFMLSRRRNKDE